MGAPNAERIQLRVLELITSAVNDDIQNVADTSFFERGDNVRIVLVSSNGCVSGVAISGLTVSGVCTDDSLVFDTAIDLTSPPAGYSYYVENFDVVDVQEGFDRIRERHTQLIGHRYELCENVIDFSLDNPVSGQGTYEIEDNVLFFDTGDEIQIICDSGILGSATVVSRALGTKTVVIDQSIDLTAQTNCCFCNVSLTLDEVLERLKDAITGIEVCNEDIGPGDCDNLAFEFDSTFLDGCEKVYIDGIRKTRGSAGTRASSTDGAGASAWTATSMILGLLGNGISIELLDPAGPSSPLAITVTGSIADGTKKISVDLETNVGSTIITTSEQLADALNADADVMRLIQVVFGGDGTGVVATYAEADMAGGLNDGTKDYATIEQVANNEISDTGYKWISFHIRPDEVNRLHLAPRSDEDLIVDYSTTP